MEEKLEKRRRETFRISQYAQPHLAEGTQVAQEPSAASSTEVTPDTARIIMHCDVDAFYSQCEENRDPSLATRPLGITQKYLVVTCNYPARAAGITKLMSVKDAKNKCPSLVLVSGEDLTPYRRASRAIMAVLERFGTAQRLGMDEVFVDITAEVAARISRGTATSSFVGHVHDGSQGGVKQGNRHRPMDLRASTQEPYLADAAIRTVHLSTGVSSAAAAAGLRDLAADSAAASWVLRLAVGSQIAAEARAAVKAEAGFRSSAGIACNRMLAKLVSGLHKPDDQTVLPPSYAAAFVAPLPARAIPGVGYKMDQQLAAMGVQTVQDLRQLSAVQLHRSFGERTAAFLTAACLGQDSTEVQAHKPPKAVTVEDSFKSCTSLEAAAAVLHILAPDLLYRLREEFQETMRAPKTLTLKWRHAGRGFARNSSSCPLPPSLQVQQAGTEPEDAQQANDIVKSAMQLLRRHVTEPVNFTLLNLGATNFAEAAGRSGSGSGGMAPALSKLLGGKAGKAASATAEQQLPPAGEAHGAVQAACSTTLRRDYGAFPSAAIMSKRAERALREASLPAAATPAAAATAPSSEAAQQACIISARPLPVSALLPMQSSSTQLPLSAQHSMPQQRLPSAVAQSIPCESAAVLPVSSVLASQAWSSLASQPHADFHPADGSSFPRKRQKLQLDDMAAASCSSTPQQAVTDLDNRCSMMADQAAAHPHALPEHVQAQRVMSQGQQAQQAQQTQHAQHIQCSQDAAGIAMNAPVPSSGSAPISLTAPQETPPIQQQATKQQKPAAAAGAERVFLHVDVDSFYCSVERLDDSSLVGVPLAVRQFNAGGFVAVSYEARAQGVRCGDGVGAQGRKHIQHLINMGAVSLEEAMRRCPDLQIRPMRTTRYRQVATELHHLLRTFAPNSVVEKASYDDFYIDLSSLQPHADPAADSEASLADSAPGGSESSQELVSMAPGSSWEDASGKLRAAVRAAQHLKREVKAKLGLSLSCGLGPTKLLARVVGPLNKPDGFTLLPHAAARAFLDGLPLKQIPSLRQKLGSRIAEELGITHVHQLAGCSEASLAAAFGATAAAFLASLPTGGPTEEVKERGPPKSILCELSFPAATTEAAVRSRLLPLAEDLWGRLTQDAEEHGRVPSRVVVTWRQGYTPPRSRSGPLGTPVLRAVHALLTQLSCDAAAAGPAAPAKDAPPEQGEPWQGLAEAAVRLLVPAIQAAKESFNITRLGISLGFDAAAAAAAAASLGQGSIKGFLKRPAQQQSCMQLQGSFAHASADSSVPAASEASAQELQSERSSLERDSAGGQLQGEAGREAVGEHMHDVAPLTSDQQSAPACQPSAVACMPAAASGISPVNEHGRLMGRQTGHHPTGGEATEEGDGASQRQMDEDQKLAAKLQAEELAQFQQMSQVRVGSSQGLTAGKGRGKRAAGPLDSFFKRQSQR